MPMIEKASYEKFAQAKAAGHSLKECYQLAGYHYHPSGPTRINRRPDVIARVEELKALRSLAEQRQATGLDEIAAIAAGMDRGYVLSRLSEVIERCMQRTPVRGVEGIWNFDSAGATRALELVGRSLGIFVDRVRLGVGPDLQTMSDTELTALAGRLAGIAGIMLPSGQREECFPEPVALSEPEPETVVDVALAPEPEPVKVAPSRDLALTFTLRPPTVAELLAGASAAPSAPSDAEEPPRIDPHWT